MRYCVHGNHRRPVSPHRAVFADATRQCDARQSAGAQRHLVRRRAGVQMARFAQAVRQLAHHLYSHEPVVEERGLGSRLCPVATSSDHPREDRSRGLGQHPRQGPSRWDRGVKKTARKPLAGLAADGPPRFIWLPRMLERPSPLPCPRARPMMPLRDASCCIASGKGPARSPC